MRKSLQIASVAVLVAASVGATYALTGLTISNTANIQTLTIPLQILDPNTRVSISTIDWGTVFQGTVISRNVVVRNTLNTAQVSVNVTHNLSASNGRFTIFNQFTGQFAESQSFILQPNQEITEQFNWEVARDAPPGSVTFDIIFS